MYARNYTDVLRSFHSKTESELRKIENEFAENPQHLNGDPFDIIDCTNGWVYDRSMFPNTVVMEVN